MVEELPLHIVDGVAVAVGDVLTLTVAEAAEEVHPFLSFTVTV